VLVLAVVLAACTAAPVAQSGLSTTPTPTPTGRPWGMLNGSPVASPPASLYVPPAFCQTSLPGAWQAAFRVGTVPHATAESTGVVAVDPVAVKGFANEYTTAWSGVVQVRGDGSRRRIFQYRNPDSQQLQSAAFDGRWLLFGVGYQLSLSPDWTLHVWDSQTGVQRQIAQGTGGGILIQVVAGSGFGAWSQTVQGRVTALHLYSFAEGADRVVSTAVQAGRSTSVRCSGPGPSCCGRA